MQQCQSQKSKMERTLNKLRREEKRMIEDCKQSEADMLSSLY